MYLVKERSYVDVRIAKTPPEDHNILGPAGIPAEAVPDPQISGDDGPWIPEAPWLAPVSAAVLTPLVYMFFGGVSGTGSLFQLVRDFC